MITFKSLVEMTPFEVHQLYKLRVDVFVAEQHCPYNEIDDQDADPDTRHILAFDRDGVIHAGNSSQISDGSGALLIMSGETAKSHGLTPIARIHTAVVAADDPVIMLTGPIPATAKALKRSGLSIDDIGAFEINEAFAPVPLAWQAETGADIERLNPLGGAIAVGHPLGGSGAILMTRLVHHMRDNGIRYGLQSMCEAGGMANTTILELL